MNREEIFIALDYDGSYSDMKITNGIKEYILELEADNKKLNKNFLNSGKLILGYLDKISMLEADKLEMAKAIVNNCIYDFRDFDYCIHCNGFGETNDIGKHEEDCIVNKANKYIKEVEK